MTVTGVVVAAQSSGRQASVAAVEGHATFVTLDLTPRLPAVFAGLAECERQREIPALLDALLASLDDCGSDLEAVFATPNVFPSPRDAILSPTGRDRAHTDANGFEWITTEYAFPLVDGSHGVTYVALVGPDMVHPETGEGYNFVMAPLAAPKGLTYTHLALTAAPAP